MDLDLTKTWPSPPSQNAEETSLLKTAKDLFKRCVSWEMVARLRFDYDYKFANADSQNKYQWEDKWITKRELEDRPCLTINKTQVHNLLIINDSKQNKPGVRIRPVGDEATFEAAQVFQEIIYHIEYISNAENVYDNAVSFQVQGGIGYWRILTDYVADDSFDQEIFIRRIKDPRSVYLDPNINEVDGSDANFGFIFDDIPKELFAAKYPRFAAIASQSVMGEKSDGWITQDNVRVCEFYRKIQKEDKLVSWFMNDELFSAKLSELDDADKTIYQSIIKNPEYQKEYQYRERKVLNEQIEWYKIAGDRIIEQGDWLGKYIPIVRVVGTETVIDGELDRKGNTRSLINPQQIYNVLSSSNIELMGLQTKSPFIGPVKAIEGQEEYWKTANTINHSMLPYNHLDEDGKEIPAPKREQPPQSSQGYVEAMKIAQDEMMMATGQYQSQFGENENAKSGVAINARQRQGDRATYHFVDNQAIAIRYTGKILLDLIPKIYDTKRIMQIATIDGKEMRVTIDPEARQAYQQNPDIRALNDKVIKDIVFNPNVGLYDLQADTGPSFATRRMEAFSALSQIAAQQGEKFLNVAGDIYFKVADFPEADILAQRYRKIIPPNILGDAPDPQTEQAMHQAADKLQQMNGVIAQQAQELQNKERDFGLRERELILREKETAVKENRGDYEAETKRVVALGNSGPGISIEQIQPVLKQLIQGMLANGELVGPGPHEGGTPVEEEEPPVDGARKAKDGKWYTEKEGKFFRVE